jgi:hypothetical protein
MKQLAFEKQCDMTMLQKEILEQVLSVQPIKGISQLIVTGNKDKTVLYIPEDLPEKDENTINLIVKNHQSPEPLETLKASKLQELVLLRNAKLDGLLVLSDGQTPRSPGETLTWGVKVEQAKKFQESGNLDSCPLLVIEIKAYLQEADHEPGAEAIEVGVRQLAQFLVSKEPLLQAASAQIVGRAGRLQNMIEEANSVEELQQLDLTEGWI